MPIVISTQSDNNDIQQVADQAARLAMLNDQGQFVTQADEPGLLFVQIGTDSTDPADWLQLQSQSEVVENAGALTDAAPVGAKLGVDTATGDLYRVDGGNWLKVETERSVYRGDWVLANAYEAGDMVRHSDKLYAANATMPVNTTFTEGTSGATWKEASKSDIVDLGHITGTFDYDAAPVQGTSYLQCVGGSATHVNPPPGMDTSSNNPAFMTYHWAGTADNGMLAVEDWKTKRRWTRNRLSGSWQDWREHGNRFIGDWLLNRAYDAGDVVHLNGKLYRANDNIPPNTAFAEGTTGATWAEVSAGGDMTGATDTVDGASGAVPQPVAGEHRHILNGAGEWITRSRPGWFVSATAMAASDPMNPAGSINAYFTPQRIEDDDLYDRFVKYTGTDTSTDPTLYVWYVGSDGNYMEVTSPSQYGKNTQHISSSGLPIGVVDTSMLTDAEMQTVATTPP